MKFSSFFPGIFLSFLLLLFLSKVMAEDMRAGQVDQQGLNKLVSDGSSSRGRKTSWPEVVGLTVEEAEKKIKEDMPTALIKVVPTDSFVTMDYVLRRVRIYVDPSGKVVAKPPRIG